MSETQQLADDLQFVRKAVEARDKKPPVAVAPLLLWAGYSLICIPSYDYAPKYAPYINNTGFIVALILAMVMGKRENIRQREYDRQLVKRNILHWGGGIALMFAAIYGLAFIGGAAKLGGDGEIFGQISIILVGFMYYFAGVHLPDVRFMRWAGPVIVLAGISIGRVPHFRWTLTGFIFAVCLLSPLVFAKRQPVQP